MSDTLSDFYQTCAIPKPAPRVKKPRTRIRVTATPKAERDHIAKIRQYVFARERGRCRCCRFRQATEMHELRPRSLRGKVSRTNSIAVDSTCHHFIQAHQITFVAVDAKAEAALFFMPRTEQARAWMKLGERLGIASPPMRELEQE